MGMNKKTQATNWGVKFGTVKSVDVSAVIYKQVRKENPYLRGASYRRRKGVAIIGTNSECY